MADLMQVGGGIISKVFEAGRDVAATTGLGSKAIAALIGVDPKQLINVIDSLYQPSLCYITIESEALSLRKTADIGTTMLISSTNFQKEYLTDNAAPRPRVWTGSGYIKALVPTVENGLVIKPSLQVQQAILEAAADSRQPVKFKTDTGEVVDVVVQDLTISATPKGPNVRAISYTVQEVKILENSILPDVEGAFGNKFMQWFDSKVESNKILKFAKTAGTAAAKSIPGRAIANLGKNTAIGTGVIAGASKLLGR